MTVLFNTIQISDIKNGQQTVTFPDYKRGVYRSVTTTPERVDDFVTERNKIEKRASRNSLIVMLGTGAVSAAVSAMVRFSKDVSRLGNAGLGACCGVVAGLIPALFIGAKEGKNLTKLTNNFINENQEF